MASQMFVTCQSSFSSSSEMDIIQKGPSHSIKLKSTQGQFDCACQDFVAMKQMKKYLTPEIVVTILKHKEALLTMGFSLEFIDSLLNFGVGKSTMQENRNSPRVDVDNVREKLSQPETISMNPSCGVSVDLSVLPNFTEEEEARLANQCSHIKKGSLIVMECKLCAYQSKSSKLMLRHLTCHDNGKCFKCSNCDYTTPFRSKWNQHRCRMIAERRNLSCDHCQESFQTKAVLDYHIATQHPDLSKKNAAKLFVCDKCPYVGRDLSSLVDHQRKHTGDYLECTKPGCSYKTPYKRSLHKHLQQKHTTDKPLVCHICGIKTKHAVSLTLHMQRHHKPSKRFKCSQCSFASHISMDVVLHLQRKHLKDKKYSCDKCSFQTVYPVALKKHIARHEAGGGQIQSRGQNVKQSGIQRVRKNKQYSCSFCEKVFKSKVEWVKHEEGCDRMLSQHMISTVAENVMEASDPKMCDFQVSDGQGVFPFDSHLESDISDEVYQITSGMLNHNGGGDRTGFTTIVDDLLGDSVLTQGGYHTQVNSDPITACKGRNPMLAETTRNLATERDDSPLLGESLLSLMSDFPRPPPTNRCQSATTLMFASLSPHLVDRPLTPDFFSDNPSSSFFV